MTSIQIVPHPPDPNPLGLSSKPIAFAEGGHHFKLTSDAVAHQLAILNKTIANVLGYACLVLISVAPPRLPLWS
jgi:hypothetical protein